MTPGETTGLSELRRPVIIRAGVTLAACALLCLLGQSAAAQQSQPQKRDDLDVTMQIIVDPDAKLPDEVVRRIPLPTRKPADSSPNAPKSGSEPDKSANGNPGSSGDGRDADKSANGRPETAGAGRDRDVAGERREHGRENSEAAKERAREAAEQREAARRAEAEERERERGPPDRPDPPNRPPRN